MNKTLQNVKEFHATFGHPVVENPSIPSKERCELRVRLIQEELDELKEAIEQGDLVECADAFADLQYVLNGAVLEFGLGNKFDELFQEVQSSNMSKACDSEEVAIETQSHYSAKGISTVITQVGLKWVVSRTSDNKILKNVYYHETALEPILNS